MLKIDFKAWTFCQFQISTFSHIFIWILAFGIDDIGSFNTYCRPPKKQFLMNWSSKLSGTASVSTKNILYSSGDNCLFKSLNFCDKNTQFLMVKNWRTSKPVLILFCTRIILKTWKRKSWKWHKAWTIKFKFEKIFLLGQIP